MSGARKDDGGKPPMDLVPRELGRAAARAFGYGAKKYARGNWMKGGLSQGRLIASLIRHIDDYKDRIDTDEESGLCQLDHAAACLAMLIATRERGLGPDDRLPEPTPEQQAKLDWTVAKPPRFEIVEVHHVGDRPSWTCSRDRGPQVLAEMIAGTYGRLPSVQNVERWLGCPDIVAIVDNGPVHG